MPLIQKSPRWYFIGLVLGGPHVSSQFKNKQPSSQRSTSWPVSIHRGEGMSLGHKKALIRSNCLIIPSLHSSWSGPFVIYTNHVTCPLKGLQRRPLTPGRTLIPLGWPLPGPGLISRPPTRPAHYTTATLAGHRCACKYASWSPLQAFIPAVPLPGTLFL